MRITPRRMVMPIVKTDPAKSRSPEQQRPGRVPFQGAPVGSERIA